MGDVYFFSFAFMISFFGFFAMKDKAPRSTLGMTMIGGSVSFAALVVEFFKVLANM